MDKKVGALLGAVTGLATMGAAHAAMPAVNAAETLQAGSYADLLAPIQNAAAVLRADDAARASRAEGNAEPVQYYYYGPPRDEYYDRRYHHHHYYHHHHHHHHHHHDRAYIGVPGVGGVIIR